MFKNKFYPFVLISIFVICHSCASILDNLGEQGKDFEVITPIQGKQCSRPTENIYQEKIISSNPVSNKVFGEFLKKSEIKKLNLTFIEKAVLWSLLQFNLRPDASAPTARAQILLTLPHNQQIKQFYFDFQSPLIENENSSTYPFIQGMRYLLTLDHSKRNLLFLGKLLDLYMEGDLLPEDEFVHFLAKNKGALIVPQKFQTAFFSR